MAKTRLANRGLYIALEGIDCIGKSTQVERLVKSFKSDPDFNSRPVFSVNEPYSGSPIAKVLREEFLSGSRKCDNETIQLLMAAARRDMFANNLDDMIHDNTHHIISDRSFLSSFAYGAIGAPNIPAVFNAFDKIMDYNHSICFNTMRIPDLTIVLMVNDETIESLLKRRGGDCEIFENVKSLQETSKNYRYAIDYINTKTNNLMSTAKIYVDNLSVDQVNEKIVNTIKEWFTF